VNDAEGGDAQGEDAQAGDAQGGDTKEEEQSERPGKTHQTRARVQKDEVENSPRNRKLNRRGENMTHAFRTDSPRY